MSLDVTTFRADPGFQKGGGTTLVFSRTAASLESRARGGGGNPKNFCVPTHFF